MAEYVTVCDYCGHKDKIWTQSPIDLKCIRCKSTIAKNRVYHPDHFDIFGYNYKEKERKDNKQQEDKHEDLVEEFERLIKEGEQEEVQEETERPEDD